MKFQITLSVMLISLLAVGAYAQTDGDPVNDQTQLRTQDRTQVRDTDNCQDIDGDKAAGGGKNQIMHHGEDNEGTDDNQNGVTPRNGDGDGGTQGPFGSGSDDDGDKAAGGGKNQIMIHGEDGEGETNLVTDVPSNGDGDGGTQGPFGSGSDDDGDKAGGKNQIMDHGVGEIHQESGVDHHGDDFVGSGESQGPLSGPDKVLDGDMLQHSWGPGMSGGGAFGPNEAHVGFGPAGSDAANGGNPAKSARGQARAGRR